MTAGLWVFGYGSLMWDPGFDFAERQVARLCGWHRSFCMASIHYRGTAQAPGLVLALDARDGGVCTGIAFRVTPGVEEPTLAALRARELISYAYHERWLELELADGRRVQALSYVINREGEQYRGELTADQQAAIIAGARGVRGANRDYLFATLAQLQAEGIEDAEMADLGRRVAALTGPG